MRMFLKILLPVAVIIFLTDRLSKWYVVDVLVLPMQPEGRMEVIPPFLNFVMAWNRGINFGLFGDGGEETRYILIAVSIVISLVLAIWAIRRGTAAMAWGAGLVVGGAIGNAWDRASSWGAVADFLNMSCCGFTNPFSFNIADIAIFAGALWVALKA